MCEICAWISESQCESVGTLNLRGHVAILAQAGSASIFFPPSSFQFVADPGDEEIICEGVQSAR